VEQRVNIVAIPSQDSTWPVIDTDIQGKWQVSTDHI